MNWEIIEENAGLAKIKVMVLAELEEMQLSI